MRYHTSHLAQISSHALACTAFVACGAVLIVGCSGGNDAAVTPTGQASARDLAAGASCDKFAQCKEIAPGKTYETREQCDVRQRSDWDARWTPRECDGKVDQAALQTCLAAIRAVECGNAIDVANIALNKCPAAKVCPPPK